MTFEQHIANYVLENYTISDLPKIGFYGIQEGLASESLTTLASMTAKDNPSEIKKYFNHALNELKIQKPELRQAAILLSLYYADEIIEGRLDPIEGLKKIIFDCIYKYNFFEECRDFALDGIYFHTLFGLYWEYYLLLEEEGSLDLDKDSSKSIEALLQEIPGEIILELKKWKSKMNDV